MRQKEARRLSGNEHLFIQHKGKEILYTDYTNLTHDTFLDVIKKAHQLILTSGKKDILQVVDLTNSFGDDKVMDELKRTAKESKAYIKKRAIVGVVGIKKVLLGVVNNFSNEKIVPFKTVEEAKDWLAQD